MYRITYIIVLNRLYISLFLPHVFLKILYCHLNCSAKQLVRGEPNVSYICSRYYRAPELIFGATDYTPSIGERLHLISKCSVSQDRFTLQIFGRLDVFLLNFCSVNQFFREIVELISL